MQPHEPRVAPCAPAALCSSLNSLMLDSSFLLDTAAGCASFVARCVDAAAPPPLAP